MNDTAFYGANLIIQPGNVIIYHQIFRHQSRIHFQLQFVHYPETKEGMEILKQSQAEVMLDILEKKLSKKKLNQLIHYME